MTLLTAGVGQGTPLVAPGGAEPAQPQFILAENVDNFGAPTGRYVDSRAPAECVLEIAARAGQPVWFVHRGVVEPNAVVTISYRDPDAGRELFAQTFRAGPSGDFVTPPTDVGRFARVGETWLWVLVNANGAHSSIKATAIEYGLLLSVPPPD